MLRRDCLDVAAGRRAPDLVVLDGRLVNVHTREVHHADVALCQDRIAFVGDAASMVGPNTEMIDAGGRFIVPGLIDTHVHTHESHLTVTEFARAVVPRGTTTILTDFYGEGVVGGREAIKFFLAEARGTPLRVLFALPIPGYYQNGEFGHTRHLWAEELLDMLDWPECWALNEVFASEIASGDEFLTRLVETGRRKRKIMLGHASEIDGPDLQKWVAVSGAVSDHEATTGDDALAKARLGVRILAREGSGARDLGPIARMLVKTGIDTRDFMFCTDLPSALQLGSLGHIDHCVRAAVDCGVDPLVAVQMATINAAAYLGIEDELGSVVPGKIADLVLVEDLRDFRPSVVIASGAVVASEGECRRALTSPDYPKWMYGTVRLARPVVPEDFVVRAPRGKGTVRVRAIGVTNGAIVTEERRVELRVGPGGSIPCDPERDVLKIAAIDRHGESDERAVGFVHGFGLKSGAFGITYNPQHENMLIVGASERDMCYVAGRLAELGGGFVLADNGASVAEVPLPILGLLSDRPFHEVVAGLSDLYRKCRELGCKIDNPVHALAFAGLPVTIGRLKMCSKGLVDVWSRKIVDVIV